MPISKSDIAAIKKMREETYRVAPFVIREGDTIGAPELVNKINEIIAVLNSLEEVKISSKDW